MKKSELVTVMAESAKISKAEASVALEAMMGAILNTLKSGEQVSLVGFGTFSVRDRKARTGRNPKTGEPIKIAAAKIPNFKAGKLLKDAVK